MPKFQIIGKGKMTNRIRKRTYQAFDETTAITMAEAEDTSVEQVIQLPTPPARPEQVDHAKSLGVPLTGNPDRFEIVISILCVLINERRKAHIIYLSDIDGKSWSPIIEPYSFQRSKQGIRLRCWVYEPKPTADVVSDFQTEGWHLYLVDDIESVLDTGESFESREYRHSTENDIVIHFGVEGFSID